MKQVDRLKLAEEAYVVQVAGKGWVVYVKDCECGKMQPLFPEDGEPLMKRQRWVTVDEGKLCLPVFTANNASRLEDTIIETWEELNPTAKEDGRQLDVYTLDGFGIEDARNAVDHNPWDSITAQLELDNDY